MTTEPVSSLKSSPSKSPFNPTSFKYSSTSSLTKVPFEISRLMDESRVEVLRKFRKEIVSNVKFCDVSRVLIACSLVSKEECFEICKLPSSQQMGQCYQKVHDIMDILVCQKGNAADAKLEENRTTSISGRERWLEENDKQAGLVKDIWKNFIKAVKAEHSSLATKMENELDKIAGGKLVLKRGGSMRSLIKKEDIGMPRDFQHVQHYSLPSDKRRGVLKVGPRMEGDGAAFEELDENDEDLKEFFKRAGVAERHLTNPVTKDVIRRFIAENGGMKAIRAEVRQSQSSKDPIQTESSEASKETDASTAITEPNSILISQPQPFVVQGNLPSNPPAAPATVPFEPTPRPTSNLFYF